MGQRTQLQTRLETLMGDEPENKLKVYFQPPENHKMEYPCIVFQRDAGDTLFADNNPYRYKQRYMVTYIDRKPDSAVLEKIAALPMCTFDRFYTAENLNHDVFTIFF